MSGHIHVLAWMSQAFSRTFGTWNVEDMLGHSLQLPGNNIVPLMLCANHPYPRTFWRNCWSKQQLRLQFSFGWCNVQTDWWSDHGFAPGPSSGEHICRVLRVKGSVRLLASALRSLRWWHVHIISTKTDAETFCATLNGLHDCLSSSQLSMKEINSCHLWMWLGHRDGDRLLRLVYRKPTFTAGFVHVLGLVFTNNQKFNLIKLLTSRAMKICSPCLLREEIAFLKQLFLKNVYHPITHRGPDNSASVEP